VNGYGHSSSGQPFTRRSFPDYLRQVSWLRGKLPSLPIYLWWLNWQTGKTISSYSCATAPDSHRLPYSFCSLQNTVNCVKNITNVQPFFHRTRGELRNFGTSELRNFGASELQNLATSELRNFGNSEVLELWTLNLWSSEVLEF
jgi:hypothetical protein